MWPNPEQITRHVTIVGRFSVPAPDPSAPPVKLLQKTGPRRLNLTIPRCPPPPSPPILTGDAGPLRKFRRLSSRRPPPDFPSRTPTAVTPALRRRPDCIMNYWQVKYQCTNFSEKRGWVGFRQHDGEDGPHARGTAWKSINNLIEGARDRIGMREPVLTGSSLAPRPAGVRPMTIRAGMRINRIGEF